MKDLKIRFTVLARGPHEDVRLIGDERFGLDDRGGGPSRLPSNRSGPLDQHDIGIKAGFVGWIEDVYPFANARLIVWSDARLQAIPHIRYQALMDIRPQGWILEVGIHSGQWTRHGFYSFCGFHQRASGPLNLPTLADNQPAASSAEGSVS